MFEFLSPSHCCTTDWLDWVSTETLLRMSCKTTISWESKTNADYHDSSIADECSQGMQKKKESYTEEQQAMKTTSDMQQPFFLLSYWDG